MKPLLYLQVPSKVRELSGKNFINIVTSLRDKLIRDYEVIVVPEGSGIDIQTDGMVKVIIDSNTDLNKLFRDLEELARLRATSDELKEIGKDHPTIMEAALITAGIPNINKREYGLNCIGTHYNPDSPDLTILAPRGIISTDGELTINSMDIVSKPVNIHISDNDAKVLHHNLNYLGMKARVPNNVISDD